MILIGTVAVALVVGCLGWFGGLRFERAGHTLRELLADVRERSATVQAPPDYAVGFPTQPPPDYYRGL